MKDLMAKTVYLLTEDNAEIGNLNSMFALDTDGESAMLTQILRYSNALPVMHYRGIIEYPTDTSAVLKGEGGKVLAKFKAVNSVMVRPDGANTCSIIYIATVEDVVLGRVDKMARRAIVAYMRKCHRYGTLFFEFMAGEIVTKHEVWIKDGGFWERAKIGEGKAIGGITKARKEHCPITLDEPKVGRATIDEDDEVGGFQLDESQEELEKRLELQYALGRELTCEQVELIRADWLAFYREPLKYRDSAVADMVVEYLKGGER